MKPLYWLLTCSSLLALAGLNGFTWAQQAAPRTPQQAAPNPPIVEAGAPAAQVKPAGQTAKQINLKKIQKTPAEWREKLTPMQFKVARQAGTERAFTGEYWNNKKAGTYTCVCCGLPLFSSEAKYKSGTGWPSFFQPVDKRFVTEKEDRSFFSVRTEVVCTRCDAHLGHVFPDGPRPTGMRYCMNSAALKFESKDKAADANKNNPGQ